jgi:hypothetical protein
MTAHQGFERLMIVSSHATGELGISHGREGLG